MRLNPIHPTPRKPIRGSRLSLTCRGGCAHKINDRFHETIRAFACNPQRLSQLLERKAVGVEGLRIQPPAATASAAARMPLRYIFGSRS